MKVGRFNVRSKKSSVGGFLAGGQKMIEALGARSVLASPWAPYVKDNLNDFIKHREWFRPFAIAVPEEDSSQYFEASAGCRFMNPTRPEMKCLPESFLLPQNRVRLHVVEKARNRLLWQLLRRFGEHAPAPMLLNTSFNLPGEPLVVTPRDALRSYSCSGLDALVIGNFVLCKSSLTTATRDVPVSESMSVGV
jgi:carbamoyltransferase